MSYYDVVKFPTIAEAEARQEIDFIEFIKTKHGEKYLGGTTSWSRITERLDGWFDYKVLPGADYGDNPVEEHDDSNYPDDDE